MSLIHARKLCVDGVRWVLNFRKAVPDASHRSYIYTTGKFGDVDKAIDHVTDHDGHSGASLWWTILQSKEIDEQGWDAWFEMNEGFLSPSEKYYQ